MVLDVVDEQEPTVLQYARFHGLCRDYTQEEPPFDGLRPPSSNTFDSGLQDPTDAPPITNPANELTKERFTVTKDAALLLKSIHLLQELPEGALSITEGWKRAQSLKQEAPLLRTDNEIDLHNFGKPTITTFTDLRIPLDSVDEENDEGLKWPSKYFEYPAQCEAQVKAEKLVVSKEVLLHLQDAIRDPFTCEDSEKLNNGGLYQKKAQALWPLTPPLLPLSPAYTPYIPSSPTNHLEPLSEESNSTAAEAKALEERMMSADALTHGDSDGSDPMLYDVAEVWQVESALDQPNSKRKSEHLRVEGPLTPPMFSDSPTKRLRSVTFSEMVQYIPELPSDFGDGNDILSAHDDFADFYQDIAPVAEEAKRKVENEKLSEADTTKRVDVPYVDFALPLAPWDEFKRKNGSHDTKETEVDAQMKFLLRVKRNDMKLTGTWHGTSKLDRELPYGPFPIPSATVRIEEKLYGEENLSKILADLSMGDIATSSTNLWKKEGLQILEDEGGSEEELEPADLEELQDPKDMDALIRKRKLEMGEETEDSRLKRKDSQSINPRLQGGLKPQQEVIESRHFNVGPPAMHMASMPRSKTQGPPHQESQTIVSRSKTSRAPAEPDRSLMFGGKFSASSALESFMATRGVVTQRPNAEKEKQSTLNHPSDIPKALSSRPNSAEHSPETTSRPPDSRTVSKQQGYLPSSRPALPPVPGNLPPCSFIISSALLQQRSLSKQIEKSYPDAAFVYRDYDLPHSAAKEAEYQLSPSTGLIITTLKLVKQRPLPGQPDRSPIKEKISCLQCRCERLVVMVTEGLSREMEEHDHSRPADARDQEAIAELEEYASQMDGEVLVRYVHGGERALARSIVGEMAKYGLPHGSQDIGDVQPTPEETTWELFLRRAGFNPFAAQVILAFLKDSVEYSLASSPLPNPSQEPVSISAYGLQAFLMLSPDQRIQTFQALLGGGRILKRINALLDQQWVSAAHGFRM